jgi:ribonuclease BN (tRNA processing enzyme)
MKVRLLGAHNLESATTSLSCVLVDDILAIDAGGLTHNLSFPAQYNLKAILLTHHHYDHMRDVPAICMNFGMVGLPLDIYAPGTVYEALSSRWLNGDTYPKFLGWPAANPRINFTELEPCRSKEIACYSVLPVPVKHQIPTVGYQVTSPGGKSVFYTGDTGPDLAECWQQINPDLLITECSAPNRFEEAYRRRGHLTPGMLQTELASFRELKGYLPQVVLIHINAGLEAEIAGEVAAVAEALQHPITMGREGMEIYL